MIKILKMLMVIVFMLNIAYAKDMKDWEAEYQFNLIFGMKSIEQLASYDEKLQDPFVREYILKDCVRNLKKAIVASDNIKIPVKIDSIDIYILIGTLYLQENNEVLALKYLLQGYERFNQVTSKDLVRKVRLQSLIGTAYLKKSEYKKALLYANKSEELLKDISVKEKDQLLSENNELFAKIYDNLGDYPNAIHYSLASVKIKEEYFKADSLHLALSYHNLGFIYSSNQEYKKAIKYMKKSLYINELKDKNSISVAKTYNNMSQIYGHMHDISNALKYLEKALKIKRMHVDNKDSGMATIYNSFGNLYEYKKEYQKAIDNYEKALSIIENDREINTIYFNMGSSYKSMKKYAKAYKFVKKSFDDFLVNRDKNFQILNNKQKDLYLKSNSEKAPLLLEIAYLYNIHNLDKEKQIEIIQETLANWLNYKGSIFDSENAIAILHANTKDVKLKSKINDLIANKRYLAKFYQSLPKPGDRKQWQRNIKKTEQKIQVLTTKISEKAESFKEQQGLKSINYKDIAKNLKENELYIDYAKAGGYYYVFSLDKNENITFTQIDENSTKKIDTLVKIFREDITRILDDASITDKRLKKLTAASKEKLSQLYELVLSKPLSKELKDKTNLILSPDGALRLIPFEAMFDKEKSKYLIEEKEIRYIPSGKELVRLYKYSKKKVSNNTVIFSNPNFNDKTAQLNKEEVSITPNTNRTGIIKSLFRMRFSPLPGTKAEAASIKQTLNNKNLIEYKKEEASESNLMQVKEPKILHIATHGFFINDNTIPNPMLKSGIALSGANKSVIKGKSDGVVTALKLSGLELRGTDLVVLSACQTGVVDINSTDSVSGLSKAFIQAGAKDIVMSLWSVNDEATKDLMSSFYQEMQIHPSYAKALKEAKLKMIEKDMHPFYWAAFVLSGL